MGKQLRDMAPWDGIAAYFQPQQVSFSIGNTPVPVLRGDAQRTIIVFGLNNSSAATIYVNLGITPAISNVSGMQVSFYDNQLLMTWDTHGPLVQQPWWAVKSQLLGPNVGLTVQVCRLRVWPADTKTPSLLEQQDNATAQSDAGRADSLRAIYRQRDNRWLQRPADTDCDISAIIRDGVCGGKWSGSGKQRLATGGGRIPAGPWGRQV